MSDYWDRRAAETMWEYMEDAEETAKAIARLYRQSCSYLTWEMREIYERFRDKHGLTDTEARQLLAQVSPDDLDRIRSALQAAADQTEKAKLLARLETPAYQYRINRLQDILDQVDGIMTRVYRQERAIAQEAYRNLAEKAYYRRIFQTQKQTGFGFSFSHVSASEIDQLVKTKWYGANYSERIWNNTQALAEQLKEELTVNFLTGRTNREAAEAIGFRFGTGIQKARRLVRTESTYLANQMEMKSYEESGIERYRFVAVLDLRTSEICRSLDGKVFPVSEQQPGKNCPPMHPYCRSTTTCELSEEELAKLKRRARNPKTGKTETVPANMTYEQWYEKYVKGDTEAELNAGEEKKQQEVRKQHEVKREEQGHAGRINENEHKNVTKILEKNDISDTMKLTDADRYVLNQYVSFDFYQINDKLRNGKKLTALESQRVENLDAALKKIPYYQGNLSRSLYFGDTDLKQGFLNSIRKKDEISFPEFISTTCASELYNPDGEVQIVIQNAVKGHDITMINEREQEVLYERNQKFRVLAVKEQDGKHWVLLEEQ